MLDRIGDAALSGRMTGLMLDTRARVQTTQLQIGSGKVAHRHVDIARDAAHFLRSDAVRLRLQQHEADSRQVADRLVVMDGAVARLADIAEHLRATLVHRLNDPTGRELPLDVEVDQLLDQVARLLNTQLDGRYLFAGSQTGQAPVVLPDPPPTTVDANLYYQGDTLALTARLDGDAVVRYGLTADQPGFARLISALGLAREGHLAGDRDQLAQALDTAAAAIDDLARARGQIGSTLGQVERLGEEHRAGLVHLDEILGRITDADPALLMARLAAERLQLEASFHVIGQLGRLSLVDHLR
jgi:flagellar hook-associated protein 3 FlgL